MIFEPLLLALAFVASIALVLEYAAEEWRETFGNGENDK